MPINTFLCVCDHKTAVTLQAKSELTEFSNRNFTIEIPKEARHAESLFMEKIIVSYDAVKNGMPVNPKVIYWTTKPPGPGWWWFTYGKEWLASPHELNVTGDGVLRSNSRTDREGYFIPATELRGWWWPVQLVRWTQTNPQN